PLDFPAALLGRLCRDRDGRVTKVKPCCKGPRRALDHRCPIVTDSRHGARRVVTRRAEYPDAPQHSVSRTGGRMHQARTPHVMWLAGVALFALAACDSPPTLAHPTAPR